MVYDPYQPRYNADSRYGIGATTRMSMSPHRRSQYAYAQEEQVRQALMQGNPDASPEDIDLAVNHYLTNMGKPNHAEERWQEHEEDRSYRKEQRKTRAEDREDRKAAADERRRESRAKRRDAELTRYKTQIDRYEQRIDTLHKEASNDMTTDARKAEITERIKRLTGERDDVYDKWEGAEKKHNLTQLLEDHPGASEEDILAELKQKANNATPDELDRLQKRADDLGLNFNVKGERAANPFQDPAKAGDFEQQPVGTMFNRDIPRSFDQGPNQAANGPKGAFSEADVAGLRGGMPERFQPPKQPFLSGADFQEAGQNLSNIGKTTAKSLDDVYQGKKPFAGSFLQGDFPAEMAQNRKEDIDTLKGGQLFANGKYPSLDDLKFWRALPALGSMIDLPTGGALNSAMGRVGKGVTDNTGSKTAGDVAQIAAGVAPIGRLGRVGKMAEEPGAAAKAYMGDRPLGLPKPPMYGGSAEWPGRPPIPSSNALVPRKPDIYKLGEGEPVTPGQPGPYNAYWDGARPPSAPRGTPALDVEGMPRQVHPDWPGRSPEWGGTKMREKQPGEIPPGGPVQQRPRGYDQAFYGENPWNRSSNTIHAGPPPDMPTGGAPPPPSGGSNGGGQLMLPPPRPPMQGPSPEMLGNIQGRQQAGPGMTGDQVRGAMPGMDKAAAGAGFTGKGLTPYRTGGPQGKTTFNDKPKGTGKDVAKKRPKTAAEIETELGLKLAKNRANPSADTELQKRWKARIEQLYPGWSKLSLEEQKKIVDGLEMKKSAKAKGGKKTSYEETFTKNFDKYKAKKKPIE